MTHPILAPICAQVLLTLLVWTYMYWTRIGAILKSGRDVQDMSDAATSDAMIGHVVNPSDNLENLFELPVLFFVASLVVLVTDQRDSFLLQCAWGFVAFRAIHSAIHCTYNRIMHRFSAYIVSALFLWAMWAKIAVSVFSR